MTIAKIQFRRGTTAQWVAEDPILSLGEPGIELKTDDSIGLKIGNGSDSWTELSYYSSEDFVTQTELNTAINGLIDSAPSALNTLNELAAALGDDSSFATTITNAIAAKADASHTHTISNITNLQTSLDAKANLAGPTFTGSVVLPSTTSIGNVNSTELSYLDGVTSAIQTQINALAGAGSPAFTLSLLGSGSLSGSSIVNVTGLDKGFIVYVLRNVTLSVSSAIVSLGFNDNAFITRSALNRAWDSWEQSRVGTTAPAGLSWGLGGFIIGANTTLPEKPVYMGQNTSHFTVTTSLPISSMRFFLDTGTFTGGTWEMWGA